MLRHAPADRPAPIRHRQAPRELHFPVEATVPETKRHLELRTLLYQVLRHAFAHEASIGCDQFVYWNAADPKRCLAPDAFVRLGAPDTPFDSWKTWERGAPELAVEIVSDADAGEKDWEAKLERYRELGVRELVRFDPESNPIEQLRVWDRVKGDLVERELSEPGRADCLTLKLWWVVVPAEGFPAALRLARDAAGKGLAPTPAEAEAKGREAAERARKAEASAREAAERRVAELEAELSRRKG